MPDDPTPQQKSWITVEEADMLYYFWREKGDVTKWSGWEEMKPKLQENCPELLSVLEKIKMNTRLVDLILDNLRIHVAR